MRQSEEWMQTQDVSAFCCPSSGGNPASLLLTCPWGRGGQGDSEPCLSLLWQCSEGGSCVLGVGAHVIHTSPPSLYVSPGPVRGSTYPMRDLWSCPVIPVLTFLYFFFSPHRDPPVHCDASWLSQAFPFPSCSFKVIWKVFVMIQWFTTSSNWTTSDI